MGRPALLVSLLTMLLSSTALASDWLPMPRFQSPGEPGFVYGESSQSRSGHRSRFFHPSVALEFGFSAGMFDGDFRAGAAANSPGLSWSGDGLDEDPAVPGFDFRMAVSASRSARWNFWYRGTLFRGYSSGLTRPVASGQSIIPAGSDLNVSAQIHRIGFDWERFWIRQPGFAGGEWAISSRLGLGWDIPSLNIDSDAFAVLVPKHTFRESIPYPFGGLVLEHRWRWDLLRIEATVGLLPEVSTLQEIRGEKVKQELTTIDLSASYDLMLADWINLGLQLGYSSYSFTQTGQTVDREISYSGPFGALRLTMRF